MQITNKDKQRFWDKVRKTKGCWDWTASKVGEGYGGFSLKHKSYLAHRISWVIRYGTIPKGMCVLHRCDNKICVNPKHLWLGTKGDNNRDRDKKGRGADRRGENHPMVELTERKILEIRKLYKVENVVQEELAKRFNISRPHISSIINKRRWKHI